MVESDKMFATNHNKPKQTRASRCWFGSRITIVEADKKLATNRNEPELHDIGT
jgi:hypothetical protein